jgi:hypothetical protein
LVKPLQGSFLTTPLGDGGIKTPGAGWAKRPLVFNDFRLNTKDTRVSTKEHEGITIIKVINNQIKKWGKVEQSGYILLILALLSEKRVWPHL